jgi:hypothetical protein
MKIRTDTGPNNDQSLSLPGSDAGVIEDSQSPLRKLSIKGPVVHQLGQPLQDETPESQQNDHLKIRKKVKMVLS